MEHPYTKPSKLQETKRLVSVKGRFLKFTEEAEGAVIDFSNVGTVVIPTSQIDKHIEVDFETQECSFKIPLWLAEDKRISYEEVS